MLEGFENAGQSAVHQACIAISEISNLIASTIKLPKFIATSIVSLVQKKGVTDIGGINP
jgi:hypothetical protein